MAERDGEDYCDLCRHGEECGCGDGCWTCDGTGYTVPDHCCVCGGNPYCQCCRRCGGYSVGTCPCPITVTTQSGPLVIEGAERG